MQRPTTASTRLRLVAPVRAAIYARVSSDQQAERHTIGSQVQGLLARAAADGHEVTAELRFLDDGHSGASLVRPALERLRDLVAMAAIDVIYVHAPDRLARSYAHQAVLIEEFRELGNAARNCLKTLREFRGIKAWIDYSHIPMRQRRCSVRHRIPPWSLPSV